MDMPSSVPPPTDGPVVAAPAPAVNIAYQDASSPMPQAAPYDASIPGEYAAAMAQGEAWNASARPLWDSAAGYGSGGFQITAPAAADDWPTGMMFPHQGP